MKTFILIFLLLSQITAYGLSKKYWTPREKVMDQTSAYKGQHGSFLSITKEEIKDLKPSLFKEDKFIEAIHEAKKQTLEVINIKNWRADSYKVEVKKNGTTTAWIKGSYLNRLKKKTYFEEFHFYSPSHKLQLLFTNSKKSDLAKDIKQVSLDQVQKDYGF